MAKKLLMASEMRRIREGVVGFMGSVELSDGGASGTGGAGSA
jgi:hypothetical protein